MVKMGAVRPLRKQRQVLDYRPVRCAREEEPIETYTGMPTLAGRA